MEQALSRGCEASPQSGLGVGCKLCSFCKKLRGLSVRAQARQVQVRNYSPGYMEQALSRGHEASPQSGLGVGWRGA